VVPIDVHMHKLASRLYNFRPSTAKRKKRNPEEEAAVNLTPYTQTADSFKRLWSPWSGWAQAIMFASNIMSIEETRLKKTAMSITN